MKAERDPFKQDSTPDYKKWQVQGTTLFTPDGEKFKIFPGYEFMLIPSQPKGEEMPKPFMKDPQGNLLPFDEWKKNSWPAP